MAAVTVQVSTGNLAAVAKPDEGAADIEQFHHTHVDDGDYKKWVTEAKCKCPFGMEQTTWSLHQKRPLLKIRLVDAWCICCKSEKYADTCWQNSDVNYVNIQRLNHVTAASVDTKGECMLKWSFVLAFFGIVWFIPVCFLWANGVTGGAGAGCAQASDGTTTGGAACGAGSPAVASAAATTGYILFGSTVAWMVPLAVILFLLGWFCCGEGSLTISPAEGLLLSYPTGKRRSGRRRATEIAKCVTREQVKFRHDFLNKHADHVHEV